MSIKESLPQHQFPRANKYNPEWLVAGISGAANPLWLTEWLTSAIDLQPEMRVLDLGCGRGASAIFLHREFGVEVWATDLWFDASEKWQRIRDAGVDKHVFPLRANARSLPFATEFFDAIVSIDSFVYYGTDDLYLQYLARFLKPGGYLGIAGAGLTKEIEGPIPEHLKSWWTPDCYCLHSASWWRKHWERSAVVDVELADTMPDGWRLWLDWHKVIAPDNKVEIDAIEADAGSHIGYVRAVARRRKEIDLAEPVEHVPAQYSKKALLRSN